MNNFKFIVDDEYLSVHQGLRVDMFLYLVLEKEAKDEYSRSQIAQSIRKGFCFVNQKMIKKCGYHVKTGDVVDVRIESARTVIEPDSSVVFETIFEDEEVLVLNKPRGLIVHPATGIKESTLVHGIYSKINKDLYADNAESFERIGIVHRLDKETSGLMVVAKTMHAKNNLQKQLRPPRTMSRVYHALCIGNIKHMKGLTSSSSKCLEYSLSAPLIRDSNNRIRYKVDFTNPRARSAESRFKILYQKGKYFLIECSLVTGRTHQIRVHTEYIGIPIVGDKVYNRNIDMQYVGQLRGLRSLSGQMLHAKELSFIHPRSHTELKFTSSYPQDFAATYDAMFL